MTGNIFARTRSLGTQLEDYNYRTTGFDYLRIILALAVVAWHSYGLSFGREAIDAFFSTSVFGPGVRLVLPMFFALSGFLVTASLYRAGSLKVYLTFRGLRLFPALTVEVLLAALVLGPLFTTLTLGAYFSDTLFWKYFLNIPGLVQFELPGLFADNIYPDVVNGSLWTVPYELECYIYLALFFALGVFRTRWMVLGVFLLLTFLSVQLGFMGAKGMVIAIKNAVLATREGLQPNLQLGTNDRLDVARILVTSFFAGSVIYAWRDKIPFHPLLALASAVISWWLLTQESLFLYAPIFVSYLTVWLGLLTPKLWGLLKKGDYSYGVYLYAFPIQQVVSMSGWAEGSYLMHLALTLLLVSGFAVFSWHVIEKPCLKLKKHFLTAPPPKTQETPVPARAGKTG